MKITKKTLLLFTLLFSFSSTSPVADESLDLIAKLSSAIVGITTGWAAQTVLKENQPEGFAKFCLSITTAALGVLGYTILTEEDQLEKYKRYKRSCATIGEWIIIQIIVRQIQNTVIGKDLSVSADFFTHFSINLFLIENLIPKYQVNS